MTRTGRFLLWTAGFLALAQTCWSQRQLDWRVYRMADGLAESACVSVSVSPSGKVLARHLNLPMVSELDGYKIRQLPAPEVGRQRMVESPGGQLWTITAAGLQEFQGDKWLLHPVAEIANEFRANPGRAFSPVSFHVIKQGRVLFLLSDRLMEFNSESPGNSRTEALRLAGQTQLEKFSTMTVTRDGGLWVAGARGLARVTAPVRHLRPDSEWREYLPPAELQLKNFAHPQEATDGSGVICLAENADDEKVIVYLNQTDWTVQPVGAARIRYAWGEPENLWAFTIDSLIKVTNGQARENEEVSARQYFDLAVEPNGVVWLATSDGLFRHTLPLWRTPPAVQSMASPVTDLKGDAQSRLWFSSGGAVHSLHEGRTREYRLPESPGGPQMILSLWPLPNGAVLVDTEDHLFQLRPETGDFRPLLPGDNSRQLRPLGSLRDGSICVQRSNSPSAGNCRLEIYDGTRFRPFPVRVPDSSRCENYSLLYATQSGEWWLSGEHGLARYHDQNWELFGFAENGITGPVVAFAEVPNGRVWCATERDVWEFDGEKWSLVRGGFDRINGMVRARDGTIWVAANGGLFRHTRDVWVENGPEEGLPSGYVRDIYEDRTGRLWVASTYGLNLFHPEADPDPPKAEITNANEKQQTISEGGSISLVFLAEDKWKYTSRNRLLYSYRLDERDWSPFQEINTVWFPDLSGGQHAVQVRVMDRNGNMDAKPARFVFTVAAPWYKEGRLVLITGIGLACVVFFAALAFNRHRQLLRSYAEVEKKVAERTRELEIASRELLRSQKMNALGTLAAGIAHDFNNILSIIKGSAQIIEDNLDNSEKVRTRVDRIKTVTEQGAGIVKAMLGFSRGSGEQPALCDLNAVAEETIKLLGDRFLREVEVTFEPGANLPAAPATKDFLQQILLNFIFNAAEAEALAKRKQVLLSTREVTQLPADLVMAPAPAARYVAVSVQDFGCGISPENLPRIFEPFFTTKALSARRGTGLGLSMVYELAKKLEAGLAVESVLDEGSTFTLILPVRELDERKTE